MADWETWSWVPAPVKEPVSAMARTISSCLKSITPDALCRVPGARREIESIYLNYAFRLSADLEGPLHFAALRILRQGAVNREVSGLIGPEFEGDRLPGA